MKHLVLYVLVFILTLISVAYLTLAERKVLGAMQLRKGPGYVGIFGLLQPIADGIKLMFKETIIPRSANKKVFFLAPVAILILSIALFTIIPMALFFPPVFLDFGVLFVLAISSLNVYGIILAGWSSNSKYAFLGAIRAAAQMVSYEVSISLILIVLLLNVGSFNLVDLVLAQQKVSYSIPFLPLAFIFFISVLAETNRTPFDLSEAEAELVAGYNVEYSSISFAMFFLSEYTSIITMSIITVLFFFGGGWYIVGKNLLLSYTSWLSLKTVFILFLFIWVRGTLPRYRYDQLMFLGWQVFLPISLALLLCFCFVWRFVIY